MSRRLVDINDKRPPLRRLLEDGLDKSSGYVWVLYAAQWPTLFKAQRLGLIDESSRMTSKGWDYLAKGKQ